MLASINDDTGETELVAIAWVDRNRRFFIQKQFWFCNPTTAEGSECFTKHVQDKHSKANGGGDD